MSFPARVVFDTSTMVGAALKPGSVPHLALALVLARSDLCGSAQTWMELEQVMQRDKFDIYLAREARLAFAAAMRQSMRFFAVTPADEAAWPLRCRDPEDDKFLAVVQVAQADALVSSDDDLLVLHPWCGVPILTPAAFLALGNVT